MLEAIFGAGGADLITDLYRILFTDWTQSETRFLLLFVMLMFGTQLRRLW